MNYQTIQEIQAAHKARGGYFFDRGTMRFFSSQILSTVFPGGVFVTSEKDRGRVVFGGFVEPAWNGERRYTVRVCRPNGDIDTVSDYGQFATRSEALAWAREYARGRVCKRSGVIL